MSLKLISFVVLLTVGTTLAQICPPAEELSHCECDEFQLKFYCHGGDPRLDLKAEFDRVIPFINDTVVFNELLITGIYIYDIEAETIKSLKFKKITIQNNDRLKFIHPDAFPGTYNTTTELNIANNKLENEEDPHAVFDFISKFTNVEQVLMHQNRISRIPDAPFSLLPNLTWIQIGGANLVDVGSRIFANLPSLENVVMYYCDINIDMLKNDTFEGITSNVMVNLEHNPFKQMPEEIFRPLLDTAKEVRIGGEFCIWGYCSHDTLDCDEQADWICQNEQAYRENLVGFYCTTEVDIWNHYCQNNSTVV